MSARNRRNRTSPVRPAVVVVAVAVFGFLVAAAVGYTLHRNRNEELHRRIVAAQRELQELQNRAELLDVQIEKLRSIEMLQRQMKRFGLALDLPRHEQYLVLPEPAPAAAAPSPAVRLAGEAPRL